MAWRRIAVAVALFAAVALATAAPGTTAAAADTGVAAATPTCNEYTTHYVYWGVYTQYPTYGSDTRNTNCLLSDSRADGIAVYVLEWSLRYCHGQTNVDVNRVFDGNTTTAVKTVQRFFGLAEDGLFGPDTSRAMLWGRYDVNGSFYSCERYP